jgi:hypothetical protein
MAKQRIGDTGLLDYVLKASSNQVRRFWVS